MRAMWSEGVDHFLSDDDVFSLVRLEVVNVCVGGRGIERAMKSREELP